MVSGIINTLVALLVGGATLSFNFSATDKGGVEVYNSSGTVVSFEESYIMETDDVMVVSDGQTKWIYQRGINELIIQSVEEGVSVMDNPFAILQSADKNYKVKATSADENNIPHRITLQAKTGALYTLEIKGYSALPAPDKSQFTFDISKYPDIIVTDMR